MGLTDRWSHTLESLRAAGRYRSVAPARGVDLCSNDYLGYAAARRSFPRSAAERDDAELARSGTGSRLLRGHVSLWDEVESALCAWHGTAACLMMNSGYVANEGLLSTIITRDDWVASDQFNHASIIDGLRLARAERFVYRHTDMTHLEDGLRAASRVRSGSRELFVVTESLFGMDGDVAPLATIIQLAEQHAAHVVVDEAHATGCFGETGAGLVDRFGLRNHVVATVHTGGKALGVTGAYVCGSTMLRELLINRCRHLMYSTALPAAVAVWWREAIARVRQDETGRSALHDAARYFRSELKDRVSAGGTEYIVPVIVGDDARCARVAAELQRRGWDIRAIRSPTVPLGTARLRISIHADHSHGLLARVAADVTKALETVS
jgi:8-amino-7-oxononanoate synthase